MLSAILKPNQTNGPATTSTHPAVSNPAAKVIKNHENSYIKATNSHFKNKIPTSNITFMDWTKQTEQTSFPWNKRIRRKIVFLDTFLDNHIAQKVKIIAQYTKNMALIRKIIAEKMQLNSMWFW